MFKIQLWLNQICSETLQKFTSNNNYFVMTPSVGVFLILFPSQFSCFNCGSQDRNGIDFLIINNVNQINELRQSF